jgi:hypothetical protein
VEGLIGHLRKHKDIREIPKSQRFANRPELGKIFPGGSSAGQREEKREGGGSGGTFWVYPLVGTVVDPIEGFSLEGVLLNKVKIIIYLFLRW